MWTSYILGRSVRDPGSSENWTESSIRGYSSHGTFDEIEPNW